MGWGTWCVLPCTVSTTSFVAEHDCQTCRISRPYRDAQDRLLWRENNLSRTSLAHHELESVNIIVIINKWQQVGSKILPPAANFDQFSDLFLARFVKPSDSAKAHKEIPVITQSSNMSVETYAATFRSTNSRITVGTPIDSTTMSGDFLHGLKGPIAKALATHEPMSTMQDLELLMAAAEEMEAEISLSSKQAPTVNAAVLPRSHTFNSVGQGGYGPIRTINAQPGGGGGAAERATGAVATEAIVHLVVEPASDPVFALMLLPVQELGVARPLTANTAAPAPTTRAAVLTV